ncbi:hypothetical protein EDB81DRAFT_848226 [Dactylonectria macrodidyma]|uniref:Uncharacterized protein n=1 Tax=Dactylonectria macrodidyma TaxID=307937 RepID=A0A9P9IE27_9HYPO|nr:hypothetical protein EDB81DRAFT_848226 [Dactylonectria macrodidyma]
MEEIRRRYKEDGHPPTGFLAPRPEPVKGVFNTSQDRLNFPGIGAGTANKIDAEGHEDLCRHPALQDFVAKMTGWGDNTLSIRQTLLRNNTPQNKAIGVHYDQIFLRHGEDTVITAWEMKNAYNQNMLGGGLLADGPAGFAKQNNWRWLLSDDEAGDVVLHNSYAIYASTINHDKDNVIRLSTDLRFVDSSRPWDTRWSNVLRPGDGL